MMDEEKEDDHQYRIDAAFLSTSFRDPIIKYKIISIPKISSLLKHIQR